MPKKTVLIIGGGIGGLSAAIGFENAGYDVHLFEQAPEISEVGAGIMVPPNAVRVLAGWGLGEEINKTAVIPDDITSYDWQTGDLVGSVKNEVNKKKYGHLAMQMYRPDLIDVLQRALKRTEIHLNKKLVSLSDDGTVVEAVFEDGSSAEGDLLIGADGIRSSVRASLFGDTEPTFRNFVTFRTKLKAEDLKDMDLPNHSVKWWGPETVHTLVYYYVHSGKYLNIAAGAPTNTWHEESWTTTGRKEDLLEAFKDFASPVPEILALAEENPSTLAMYDRESPSSWTQGRVGLIGDAAHAMIPLMGQGAAMAIEDAAVLSNIFEHHKDLTIEERFRKYFLVRKDRAETIQTKSREVNPEEWDITDWLYSYNALDLELIA